MKKGIWFSSATAAERFRAEKPFVAVLFDLDGTLVDTLEGLTQLVNWMRADFEKRPLSKEVVSNYIGKGVRVLIHRALTESMDKRLSDALFQMALKSMTKHLEEGRYNKGVLYPDIKDSLERIREKGLRMAVVTNKGVVPAKETLEELGIAHFFDAVVGGDSTASPKPAADPVLAVCKLLDIAPENSVFIGDSANDALAGRAAGAEVVLVRTGWSEGIPLTDVALSADAAAIADKMSDAVDLILE